MNFRQIVLTAAFLAVSTASADVTEELTFNYELSDGGRLSVDNINGDVTVTGGRGNKVQIVALKKAKNQDKLDEIEIIIDHSSDAIRIETFWPSKSFSV